MDINKALQWLTTQKGIPKSKIDEISKIASKYDATPQGFMKAVNENGGTAMLDKAMKMIDSPMAKMLLPVFGVNKEKIDAFKSDINALQGSNFNSNSVRGNNAINVSSNYLERLKNLK